MNERAGQYANTIYGLKFEFHIIFIGHRLILLLIYFNHCRMRKRCLVCRDLQNQLGGPRIWPLFAELQLRKFPVVLILPTGCPRKWWLARRM